MKTDRKITEPDEYTVRCAAAVIQINANRAIPLRRVSCEKTIFEIREGHNRWFVLYDKRRHRVEKELTEAEARLKPGDKVTWQEDGKPLAGKVAVVVPPNTRLTDKLDAFRKAGYDTKLIETSDRARHQVSYLVNVNKVLYWPLVAKLRLCA